jgi:hypothetical protein
MSSAEPSGMATRDGSTLVSTIRYLPAADGGSRKVALSV